jgi:hypothetical protein
MLPRPKRAAFRPVYFSFFAAAAFAFR